MLELIRGIILEILHNFIATYLQYFSNYNLLNCNTAIVNCNIFYKIFFNTVVIHLIKYKKFNITSNTVAIFIILLQYFVL